MSVKGHDYHRINGASRTEPVKLSEEELAAMAREVMSVRHMDRDFKKRRRSHVKECREKL